MDAEPEILFGHCVRGFPEWYREHYEYIKTLFTKPAEAIYGSLEDFAVEIYLTLKVGYDPEPKEDVTLDSDKTSVKLTV